MLTPLLHTLTQNHVSLNRATNYVAPIVLATVQIILSAVRGILLQIGAINGHANAVAILTFLLESLLTLTLSALVCANAWRAARPDLTAVRSATILLILTALIVIFVAARQLRAHWAASPYAPYAAYRGEIWKVFAFVNGIASLCVAFAGEGVPSAFRAKAASPFVIRFLLSLIFIATVVTYIISIIFLKRYRLRANFAIAFLVVASVCAIVFSCTGMFDGGLEARTAGSSIPLVAHFQFQFHALVALFCAVAACLLVALAAWDAPDFANHGCIQPPHARLLEVAALALAGPLLVLSMSERAAKDARQIVFAVLTQMGLLTIPLLFSYGATIFQRKQVIHVITEESSGWSSSHPQES